MSNALKCLHSPQTNAFNISCTLPLQSYFERYFSHGYELFTSWVSPALLTQSKWRMKVVSAERPDIVHFMFFSGKCSRMMEKALFWWKLRSELNILTNATTLTLYFGRVKASINFFLRTESWYFFGHRAWQSVELKISVQREKAHLSTLLSQSYSLHFFLDTIKTS